VIEYIDGWGIGEGERRLLRRSDPMLGQPLVIDPMPASGCADLLAGIYQELGVPSTMAVDLKHAGRHMLPLRAWRVPVVVFLDADCVAEGALRDLAALPDRGDTRIVATLDRAGERLGAVGSVDELRRTARGLADRAEPEITRLRPASVERIGAVGHQAGRVLDSPCSAREVAFVAAAATVFHRPRGDRGTALRLFGLDHALRKHGYEVGYTDEMFSLARRGAWPREWLLDSLRPHPARQDPLPIGDALAKPMTADSETVRIFLSNQSPASATVYQGALVALLRWREETAIPRDRHDVDDLVAWAHDLLRNGETLGYVQTRLGVARSYYRFLKSGTYVSRKAITRAQRREALAIHPDLTGYALADPFETLSVEAQPALTDHRRFPIWSMLGRRLAEHRGWTDAEFWRAVDDCRPPSNLWPLREGARSTLYAERERERDRCRLHGALFVLKFDIAISALPPEVGAGSWLTVVKWVRRARRTGEWDTAAKQLRGWPAFTHVAWSRHL